MNEDDLRVDLQRLRAQLYELQKRLDASHADEELPRGSFGVLVCRLANERVALRLEHVLEVVPVAETSRMPEAPPWIPGMLDVRGEHVLVLDVIARVQRQAREVELGDLIVICRHHERKVGLVVQGVYDVLQVTFEDLHTDMHMVPHGPYVIGTLGVGDELTFLISIGRLLATSDLPNIDAASEASEASSTHGGDV